MLLAWHRRLAAKKHGTSGRRRPAILLTMQAMPTIHPVNDIADDGSVVAQPHASAAQVTESASPGGTC